MSELQQVNALVGSQTILYRLDILDAVKDVNTCLFASWLRQYSSEATDFWVYATKDMVLEATGLSNEKMDSARKKLRDLGFLEEREERLAHKMYYRLVGPIAAKKKRRTI